ncbi:MAG: hypothetical protein JWM57_2894 [Phycisphaerales bacterium]|nr:hypothetical protein [Phycisphaerales bacterium]
MRILRPNLNELWLSVGVVLLGALTFGAAPRPHAADLFGMGILVAVGWLLWFNAIRDLRRMIPGVKVLAILWPIGLVAASGWVINGYVY